MRYLQRGELIEPTLIRHFATGWARTRGVPPPIVDGHALRIEVGQPDQIRRFVFPAPPAGIAEVGTRIDQPSILLKTWIDPEVVQALLPPCWHVEQTGTMMTLDALPTGAAPLADGFTLELDDRSDVVAVQVTAADGAPAARGLLTVIDGWALHDRIHVEAPYRRLGLGRAVMQSLGAEGARRGAQHGILAATDMGRALYQLIGWHARAPWTTAQIMP